MIKRLDHQFINDLEPFTTVNPSAENMAKYFYDEISGQLKDLPPGARVYRRGHLGDRHGHGEVSARELTRGLRRNMNRSILIILIPALLVAAGYIVVLRMMGFAPGYPRLVIAMILFFGGIYWLSKRSGKKANTSGQ